MPLSPRENVPLAPLTTLELGGPARFFVAASDETTVAEAAAWAARRSLPLLLLGGGSNLVLPDAGVEALVVRLDLRGVTYQPQADGTVLCAAAAGEPWDDLVQAAVARGLAGLECLSGIPGRAGATPIQNVGAYGQEVADTIRQVRAFDREAGAIVSVPAPACGFAYRDSAFKRDPGRHVVLSVDYALVPGGLPSVRYPELARALRAANPAGDSAPSLVEVREAVLALRRSKSMVLSPGDPNRRSVGSFFMNPIVDGARAQAVVDAALGAGIVTQAEQVPRFPAPAGRVKLAAGWLIEKAGIARGLRRGPVGVSSAHALALVHHGGGTTAELLGLAREVRAAVEARFGIRLSPEPVIVGARPDDPLALAG